MNEVNIKVGQKLFEFTTFQQWVNNAQSWFRNAGADGRNSICIDADGRICQKGLEFMRADKEGKFPISVYKALC